MANETIFYRAATCNMGETSEQDADKYRAWAKAEIEAAYPEAAQIEVLDEDRGSTVYADDYTEECTALEFMYHLWDRCPWSGEYFN